MFAKSIKTIEHICVISFFMFVVFACNLFCILIQSKIDSVRTQMANSHNGMKGFASSSASHSQHSLASEASGDNNTNTELLNLCLADVKWLSDVGLVLFILNFVFVPHELICIL